MHPFTPLLRCLPLLPTGGALLLALSVLQPSAALAEECTTDPFGAEVCLPDNDPPPPTPVSTDTRAPTTSPSVRSPRLISTTLPS